MNATQTMDDISAAITNAAAMIEAERVAREAITTRRGKMMRANNGQGYDASEAFYASLAIRLKLEAAGPESGVETMATDGERLLYSPPFVADLDFGNKGELHAVIVHEAMHCAHFHHARMPGECRTDPDAHHDANIAADMAINGTIAGAGFKLPADAVFAGKAPYADFPLDLSMEQYYVLLRKDRDENGGKGRCDGKPGPGGIIPADNPAKATQQAQEWKLAVAHAEKYAKERGDIPAGLQRQIDGILRPSYELADVLNEYITRVRHDKANWNVRNRRYSDVYLPGKLNRTLGEIVIVLDCSGSIDDSVLRRAAEISQAAVEANPALLTVLCHDVQVTSVQTWSPGDDPLVIDPKGGGGTDHRPAFEWIGKMGQMGEGEGPELVICLTDCYTQYPAAGPECDVVWARFGGGGTTPPFGRVLDVEG